MYNKQEWLDEIPDMTRPIMDSSTGKQKTDPQTGRPLFELVQVGTRITSNRLMHMEEGIEGAHVLVEQLAKELGGNFVATIDGTMGLQCSAQGLTATWTYGVAYVNGRRFEVAAGEITLNPTQGQYLYVDLDGAVKKTKSQATAKADLTLCYVATDTSGVISSADQRPKISLEELLKMIENIKVPEGSLTQKGIVQMSDSSDSNDNSKAATPSAVKKVNDNLNTHINNNSPHGAVSAATANRLVIRDANGRSQIAAPSAAADIANLGTVTGQVGTLSNLLTAAKENTVAAINELFTSVVNGKVGIAAVIIDMGGYALGSYAFAELAAAIRALPVKKYAEGLATISTDYILGVNYIHVTGLGFKPTMIVAHHMNVVTNTSRITTTYTDFPLRADGYGQSYRGEYVSCGRD